jgi:RNA-splicing ligase RtcB
VSQIIPRAFDYCGQKYFDNRVSFERAVRDTVHRLEVDSSATEVDDRLVKVWCSSGTLGGGNHFIEIGKDEDGIYWLTIHSGSRNFGLRVATHHQKVAIKNCHGSMGGLEYLEGDDRDTYVNDMKVAQVFAQLNRKVMALALGEYLGFVDIPASTIESVHNYINFEDGIVRKGAISAHAGEWVTIPLTMADGCVIGRGKGLEDWNYSAPHGAGRVMSRGQAKKKIDLDHYRKVMREAHVWSSCVGKGTLDEAPMAYRRAKGIVERIKETVDIEKMVKPVYNFKAGG